MAEDNRGLQELQCDQLRPIIGQYRQNVEARPALRMTIEAMVSENPLLLGCNLISVSLLHCFCWVGDAESVELILSLMKRFDRMDLLDIPDKTFHDTPLHVATSKGDLPVVNLLLAAGSKAWSIRADRGETPLHSAAICNTWNVMLPLLRAGGDVEAMSNTNRSPLDYAESARNIEAIKLLGSCSTNPKTHQRLGLTEGEILENREKVFFSGSLVSSLISLC